MPAGIWLNKFGTIVTDAFGQVPYQVGSSLHTKAWRDVDVRLIMPDAEFDRWFGLSHPRSRTASSQRSRSLSLRSDAR